MSPDAAPEYGSLEFRLLRLERELAMAGGRVGALSVRDVVVPAAILLFLRWLEHYEAEQAALAAFEGRDHAPALPGELNWQALKDKRGAELARHLDEIMLPSAYAQARGSSREKYLREVVQPKVDQVLAHPYGQAIRQLALAWPKLQALSDNVRDALLQLVQDLPFDRLEDREQAEQLLATMVREGATGRSAFYTPQAAADLMIEVARPQPGERIYDPCYGAGNLLVSAARRLRQEASRFPARQWDDIQHNSLFGVEHYPHYYFVGLVRVILSGIEHPGLELGDALQRPRLRSLSREGFDCILSIPPWRKLERGYSGSGGFDIPTTSSEGLFLQHIAASLRPGGRAVVALPASFLASAGSEKRVRKMLLEDFRVEGVIGLPANVFKPYTNTESSLLVFSREKPVEAVRFLRAKGLRGIGPWPDSPGTQSPQQVAKDFLARKLPEDAWTTSVGQLARREWDLSPKPTGAEELDDVLDTIVRTDPQTRLLPLGQLAELWTGVSYGRYDTLEIGLAAYERSVEVELINNMANLPEPLRKTLLDRGHLPRIIRADDIKGLELARPSLALMNGELYEKHLNRSLAAGDVLIRTSGSIGHVAVVPEWGTGNLTSNSLATIRLHGNSIGVLPKYLAGILSSDRYQRWMSGHARGAVSQRLSISALKTLPIPVPHLAIQEHVVTAVRTQEVDAFDELLRLLDSQQTDAVTLWLEQAEPLLVGLEATYSRQGEVGALLELEGGAAEFLKLRDNLPPGDREDLPRWAYSAWAAAEKLRGISGVPQGSALLAVLGSARGDLTQALADIAPDSAGAERARRFCATVVAVIDAQVESIMSEVRIVPKLVTRVLEQASIDEIHVTLLNQSQTPLLKFQASSPQCHGDITAMSLEAGEGLDLTLVAEVTKPDQFDFVVAWRAARLDGVAVRGELPLSIRVVAGKDVAVESVARAAARPAARVSMRPPSPQAELPMSVASFDLNEHDLGPNPYVTGTPIIRPDMFYGRSGILDSIKRHLGSSTHRNVILLEGNRRAGKSSILAQLELPDALPNWVVARCDFQGAPGHNELPGIPTDHVYGHLAQQIAEAGLRYGFNFWPPGQEDYNPKKPYRLEFRRAFSNEIKVLPAFDAFKELLEAVVESIAPKRLLLMLDEFDRIQEGIDSGVTSPQVPQNIRFLMNNYTAVTAILTGSRRMTQMRKEYWSVLFGLGHKVSVTAIDEASARRLVTEPVKGRLAYPPTLVDRIIRLCACQPFLIQRLCSQIFDRCSHTEQAAVTSAMVEDAAQELVSGMEHFEAFWDFAGSERARFILCIVHRLSREADAVPITLPMIEDELERSGVQFKRDELVGDELKKLIELELVSLEKDGQYRLAVPLLALWIRNNKDFEDQRERAAQEGRIRSLT